MMPKTFESKQEAYLERLKGMRLIDDTLMSVVFQKIECTQFLLRLVLENDALVVANVSTQHNLPNLHGRGVRFDVTAHDAEGKMYNIEVQRADYGAVPKRARYNSGMMDSNITVAGETYDDLPESYVVFITENDVFKKGLPLYHIERVIQETGELFDDKAHIIYANAAYVGDDPIGKLMHDFRCLDVDEMNYSLLADETRRYKEKPEGVQYMCKIMEDLASESRKEGLVEMAISSVKSLMESLGKSAAEAMELLNIPEELRPQIIAAIEG